MNALTAEAPAPRDRLGRPLHDLRVSVIETCNFRCPYCMPADSTPPDGTLGRAGRLDFDEIETAVRAFARLGVSKLRLTGGEPLLRKNLEILIEQLSALRTPTGQPRRCARSTPWMPVARTLLAPNQPLAAAFTLWPIIIIVVLVTTPKINNTKSVLRLCNPVPTTQSRFLADGNNRKPCLWPDSNSIDIAVQWYVCQCFHSTRFKCISGR